MEQKKTFEPFERVIYRTQDGFWNCGFYSHEDGEHHYLCGAIIVWKEHDFILPFAGNSHLVGTSDMSVDEVVPKSGDVIVTFDEMKDIEKPFDVSINEFKSTSVDAINVSVKDVNFEFISYSKYCIPFSKFNPNDMEETKKHILCVKNGKLVRAIV